MSRSSGGRLSSLVWGGVSSLLAWWKFEAHFARLGHQPLHLRAQVLVFFNQQLLALQHRCEALRELAFKNVGEVFKQFFQLLSLDAA